MRVRVKISRKLNENRGPEETNTHRKYLKREKQEVT